MIYLSAKQLAGAVAMWAVRQSPYQAPANLEKVVVAVQDRFEPNAEFGFREIYEGDVRKYLCELLRGIPEYMAWNERKNGNAAPLKFISRYDGRGDPDDDFIDLDALEQNVAKSIADEE
jgi:hypothetical protein